VLCTRDQAGHGVGGVLPGAVRGLRPEHRRARPQLRWRGPEGAPADSASLATLVGSGDRYLWPQTHDLRHIPLHDPTPVHPHVLLFRSGDQHPVLTALRVHLRTAGPRTPHDVWAPGWVDRW